MNNFPEQVMNGVFVLNQIYQKTKNCVVAEFPVIEILKYKGNYEVSVRLFFNGETGMFELQSPVYRYRSKISYYDYRNVEFRWIRNKEYLFSLIRNLKLSGLWPLITNQDFLTVNRHNHSSDHKILSKNLKNLKKDTTR